ncbi:MAG: class II aldolase/adducin family protein [Hasllibacter sp.]
MDDLRTADLAAEGRRDLACAFRWAAREDLHEGVANHFSLALDGSGRRVLMNPDQVHFERITASRLIEVDTDDPATMDRPGAPDPTAWGLHGGIHRACPHARCVLHLHPPHATALAALADSRLPAVDQNAAMFHGRVAVDEGYAGLAFEAEGARMAAHLADPVIKVLVMGNHGVLSVGATVAEAWTWLYHFERACRTYLLALATGRPLRVLPDGVAATVARQTDAYPGFGTRLLAEMRAVLDHEGSDYAT